MDTESALPTDATADLSALLSPSEVAKRLGVTPRTVRRMLQDGKLPFVLGRNGGRVVRESDLAAVMEGGQADSETACPRPGHTGGRPDSVALAARMTADVSARLEAAMSATASALVQLGDEKAARSAAEAEAKQLRERLEEERERRRIAEADARGARDTLATLRRRGLWSRMFNREG